ncbi:MAG: hypothetical protein IPM58_00815 [Nitrospira sp.]|nr:hypothetical protein [Nitrospira sp.]
MDVLHRQLPKSATGLMRRIVQYGSYPVILLGSVWGNLRLTEAGAGLLISTYLPVTTGSLLVIWLEHPDALSNLMEAIWEGRG